MSHTSYFSRRRHRYFTYILANAARTCLYVGITNNLRRRLSEHRANPPWTHTGRYHIHDLLYFEKYRYVLDAIGREKQLKNWKREWKWDLIKRVNPELRTLTP